MTIPVELLVWLLGANGIFLSFCVHLLISMNGKISRVCTTHEVAQRQTELEIAALKRHTARNEAETAQLQRHLGFTQPHRPHAG